MAVDKRTLLLDAAEAVLVEQGLAGATIDQITSRAGVAKGTFYLYFRSQDEVVGALQQRHWNGMMAAAGEAAAQMTEASDWWGVVDSFIETVVDFDLEHRAWHQLIGQGWSAPQGEITPEHEQQMIDLFEERIRDAAAQGKIDGGDTALTAMLLYRAIEGTSHQLCRGDGEIDRDRVVNAIKWFVRRVLQGST